MFLRVQTESLQDDESDEREGNMTHHSLIHIALASAQAAELLGITDQRWRLRCTMVVKSLLKSLVASTS